jgi:hypothetical protein
LQRLLREHTHQLLAGWPAGALQQPESIPSVALWVGAALNNIAWAGSRTEPRLFTITLRMSRALPAASSVEAALTYHSLLRHIETMRPAQEWQPVIRALLERSPLTAAWLPRVSDALEWSLLLDLLTHHPVRAALRDRILALLPQPVATNLHALDTPTAVANAEVGRLLEGLLQQGGAAVQPFVLALYEADCMVQRRGSDEHPEWPLMTNLHAARHDHDPLLRRNANRVLARYRPLAALLGDEALLRPYTYLDGRFLEHISNLLSHPTARLRFQRQAAASETSAQ